MGADFLIVSQVARILGVRPRDISDLFYARALDDSECPIVGGRRLIPRSYVNRVADVLRERGVDLQFPGSNPGAA